MSLYYASYELLLAAEASMPGPTGERILEAVPQPGRQMLSTSLADCAPAQVWQAPGGSLDVPQEPPSHT